MRFKKEPDIPEHELDEKSPHELMVASLADGIPVHYCGGVMLQQGNPGSVDLINCKEPNQFMDILEQGHFCIEIPAESMTSDVLTEKLLKAEPTSRPKLLAKLMYAHHIPRVIIVAPHHICA